MGLDARRTKHVIRGLELSVSSPWHSGRAEGLEDESTANSQWFNQAYLCIGLAKKFGFFHNILRKGPNKLSGQPSNKASIQSQKNGSQITSGLVNMWRFGRVACVERIRKFSACSLYFAPSVSSMWFFFFFLTYSRHSTGRPHYIVLHIQCASQLLRFLQIESLWQLSVKQVYWHCFSNSIAHFGYLCYILIIFATFQTFHPCYICCGDLWSVVFDVTVVAVLGWLDPRTKCDGGCHWLTKRGREELPHVPRSESEAGRTPCPKGGGQEELPHVRGQGQRPRVPGWNSAGTAEKSYPSPRSGAAVGRSYPTSEVRDGGWEELPHARGQGRRPGGPTPRPRSGGCAGAGGPSGAIPCWRSGRAVVRRYPSSKVRSSGCALLEQPWRNNPRPR